MHQVLILFIIIPLVGYLVSLLVPKQQEKRIAFITMLTTLLQLLSSLAFGVHWVQHGQTTIDHKLVTLLTTPEFEFYIDFMYDCNSAVFLLVGSIIGFLVALFSKFYIHREEGYKRFFNNIQ